MQPFLYKKIRKKRDISVMISEHFDGEIISKLINLFKFNSIRGSSKRGGVKALAKALRAIKTQDIAITPDGPRGPMHSVADGVVAISKKSKAKVVLFNIKVDRYWRLNSWDKFIIPKPFSNIEFFVSEPISLSELDSESAKNYIKERLLENAI